MRNKFFIFGLICFGALLFSNVGSAQVADPHPDVYVHLSVGAIGGSLFSFQYAEWNAEMAADDKLEEAITNASPPPGYQLKGVVRHGTTIVGTWRDVSILEEYRAGAQASATVVFEYIGPLPPDPSDP
jgi:hypothetical protein